MKQIFIFFLISFLISFLITVPAARVLALYLKIIDVPDGRLKVHNKATPYLGGAAIFISIWILLFLFIDVDRYLCGLFFGTSIVFITGLVDDVFLLQPKQKIVFQVIAAVIFVNYGYCLNLANYDLLNQFFSIFWIISLINAFNLVDVMDGLAVTIGITITGALMVYGYLFDQSVLLFIIAIFLGAQIGFLCYNRPRATIYMGDAGSMLLGAIIAVLTLRLRWASLAQYNGDCLVKYLVPLIVVGLPLFEVVCLIVIRKFKKIPFYKGSPDHFAHYLKRKTWSEWQILAYVALCNCTLFIFSLMTAYSKLPFSILLFIGFGLVAIWVFVVFFKNSVFFVKK